MGTDALEDGDAARGARRERSLVYSLRDGMAWSAMVGFGENYVGPYALFLSASTMQMGILAALPAFLGALSQVFSANLTDRIVVRRRIIVPAALLQGLLWIPLVALPLVFRGEGVAVPILILMVVLFSVSGHFISPAWNSLMGDLVHPDRRGIYFARRNRICHLFMIVSVGLAGSILHFFETGGPGGPASGFLMIFGVACAARLVSAAYLSMQYEPPYTPPPKTAQFGYLEFLRATPRSNFARYALFIAAMSFSIHFSAPFFSVYLLRDLKFTYLQFTAVTTLVVLSQILTLTFWGRASDRFGNKWVLGASGLLIGVMPFFLPLSSHFIYILAYSFAISAAGAGFSLAAANYIFDAVSPPHRARCVAYFHVTSAVGLLLGGLAGGWLSDRVPAGFDLGFFNVHFESALLTLFWISGAFRLLTLWAFRSAFRELRAVEPPPVHVSDFLR